MGPSCGIASRGQKLHAALQRFVSSMSMVNVDGTAVPAPRSAVRERTAADPAATLAVAACITAVWREPA
jgi:hypothetical protein